jgi:hypothetical protein
VSLSAGVQFRLLANQSLVIFSTLLVTCSFALFVPDRMSEIGAADLTRVCDSKWYPVGLSFVRPTSPADVSSVHIKFAVDYSSLSGELMFSCTVHMDRPKKQPLRYLMSEGSIYINGADLESSSINRTDLFKAVMKQSAVVIDVSASSPSVQITVSSI